MIEAKKTSVVKLTSDLKGIVQKLEQIQNENIELFKEATNPHFKNKYAPFNSTMMKLKPILNKHRVVIKYYTKVQENSNNVLLILNITDSESMEYNESSMPIDISKGPQQIGSQITYFKRYLTECMFALPVTDGSDDDAEMVERPEITSKVVTPTTPTTSEAAPVWLNTGTPEWSIVLKAIDDKKITHIYQVRAKYAVNNETAKKLKELGIQ